MSLLFIPYDTLLTQDEIRANVSGEIKGVWRTRPRRRIPNFNSDPLPSLSDADSNRSDDRTQIQYVPRCAVAGRLGGAQNA